MVVSCHRAPHASGRPPRVSLSQPSVPRPHFPTSQCSQEFPWPARQLLGCTPASVVVAQPQDRRKGLETVTETSMVYWTGYLMHPKQKGLEQHPHCERQPAGRTLQAICTAMGRWRLPFIGGSDVTLAHQLPRKPAAGARPSQPSG